MNHSVARAALTDRHEELLTQLEELVLGSGFKRTTVDALAAELRCSKTTLYRIAPSREQIVVAVVKHFFGHAAKGIEADVLAIADPRDRIGAYLAGVGRHMRRASPAFYEDMTSFGPTADIYRHNSRVAARRVRELIADGVRAGAFRPVHADFAGHVVSLVIQAIQHGELLDATGLSSGDAYAELSELLVRGLTEGTAASAHT